MKKVFICLLSFTFINLLYGYTDKHSMPASKSVLCETDNIEILRQVVDPAKDEYDIDVVALWLRDKNTGKETKLLQTTRPDWRYWHMSDSKIFIRYRMIRFLLLQELISTIVIRCRLL